RASMARRAMSRNRVRGSKESATGKPLHAISAGGNQEPFGRGLCFTFARARPTGGSSALDGAEAVPPGTRSRIEVRSGFREGWRAHLRVGHDRSRLDTALPADACPYGWAGARAKFKLAIGAVPHPHPERSQSLPHCF